jgi:hypothetical protein
MGPSIVRIRLSCHGRSAIHNKPQQDAYVGNRKEALIHVKPGYVPDEMIPYIDGLGNMAVCDIDQSMDGKPEKAS